MVVLCLKSSAPSLSHTHEVWVNRSVKEIRQNTSSHHGASPSIAHVQWPASGGFKVISLPLFYWWFPSNMKHFFSHLTTYACTASGLFRIHRQPETTVWRQLCQACKSSQALHWITHRHIYTLILDLYGVLHPPLNAAVKAFLDSCRSSIFKKVHVRTHEHTPESFKDL